MAGISKNCLNSVRKRFRFLILGNIRLQHLDDAGLRELADKCARLARILGP